MSVQEKLPLNQVVCGDSLEVMRRWPSDSVDLIWTSPPYDNRRSYGGVEAKDYLTWLAPFFQEFKRILTPHGNILFNIANKWQNWKTHTYTYKIPVICEGLGLRFIEDIIWHQLTGYPNRPLKMIDVWEHIYWFNKVGGAPTFYHDNIRRKYASSTLKRFSSKFKNHHTVDDELRGNWKGDYEFRQANPLGALPFNLIALAVETRNKYKHPAVYPLTLAEWVVKGWSKEGDIVLDPFMGSGTTAEACINNHRRWVGVEMREDYCDLIRRRTTPLMAQTCLEHTMINS